MRGINSSLDSQKNPSTRLIDFVNLRDRAVLAIEGGSPGDLDFRFKVNRILRSSRTKTSITVSLRRPKKSVLIWEDTVKVTMSDLDEAEEGLVNEKFSIGEDIKKLSPPPSNGDGEEGLDQSCSSTSLPGIKTTKKGKVLKFLSEIEQEQLTTKKLNELRERLVSLDKDIVLIGKTRAHSEATILARLNAGWRKWHLDNPDATRETYEVSSYANSIREEAFLPKLTSPVLGVTVTHNCEKFLPEPDWPAFLNFLERHPSDPLWYAPQQAIEGGKVRPLSHDAYVWLCKNQASKSIKISALDKSAKEKVAWRWLIISYNSLHPTARVPLDKKLSVHYERKSLLPQGPGPAKEKRQSDTSNTDAIKSLLNAFNDTIKGTRVVPPGAVLVEESVMDSFLSDTNKLVSRLASGYAVFEGAEYKQKPSYKGEDAAAIIPILNAWLDRADAFSKGKVQAVPPDMSGIEKVVEDSRAPEIPRSPVSLPSVCDEEDELDSPPESFDSDGLVWFREDIDLLDIHEGQTFLSRQKYGVTYHAMQGKAESSESLSAVRKGKTPVRPQPESSKDKGKVGKPSGKPEKPTSPLNEENPLQVKGEPKSKALSDSQRESLRKFFKLKEGLIPAEEWSKMDNKARALAMAERSIPRWATSAVLKRESNLQLILEGKLTKENIGTALETSVPKQKGGSSQALEAWQKLRSDFSGVTLFRNPVTAKEKAFKKRFVTLVAEYGEQRCFPKLKDRPDQQGRGRSQSRGKGPDDAMGSLIQLATAFGQIARAFKS
nr:hypothetical protein [Sclerotinia sclerotiorum narnavirus 4-HC025]